MAGNLQANIIIRAIDRATSTLRRVTKNFESMRVAQKRASAAFQQAANLRQAAAGVDRFANATRKAVLAPVGAFETFQEAAAELKGVSGLTGDALKVLTDEAIRLGTSIGEFSPTDAVRGMTELRRAGYASEDILQTLPSLLDLSTTSGIDLAGATKIVTGVMGGFGMGAEEANRAVDVLTATANNSKTTIDTLGETFGYLAPVARSAGLTLEQTAVLAGALGNSSIEASRAGTALNAVLLRFAGARRGPGSKILKDMGVELDTIVDGVKKARDPLLVFADINKRIAKFSERKQLGILGRIFGPEAAPGAAILAKAMGDSRTAVLQATVATADVSDGTAVMAKTFRETGKNETMQLTSALETLGIVIGQQLEPAISRLKMSVLSVVEGVTLWAREHPALTKVIFGSLGVVSLLATGLVGLIITLAAATTAAGVFSLALGGQRTGVELLGAALKPIGSTLRRSIPAITTWAASWWPAAAGVNATLWPILAIIAAIVLLTAGVYFAIKYWDQLVAIWDRFRSVSLKTKIVIAALLLPFHMLLAPIIALISLIKTLLPYWDELKTAFAAPFVFVIDQIKAVIGWLDKIRIPEPIQKFLDLHAQLGAGAAEIVGGLGAELKEALSEIRAELAYVATGGPAEAGTVEYRTSEAMRRTNDVSVGGKLKIDVNAQGQAKVTKVEATGIDLDVGYAVGMLPY